MADRSHECCLYYPDDLVLVGGKYLGFSTDLQITLTNPAPSSPERGSLWIQIHMPMDYSDDEYADWIDETLSRPKKRVITIKLLPGTYKMSWSDLSTEHRRLVFPKNEKRQFSCMHVKVEQPPIVEGIGHHFRGRTADITSTVLESRRFQGFRSLREIFNQETFNIIFLARNMTQSQFDDNYDRGIEHSSTITRHSSPTHPPSQSTQERIRDFQRRLLQDFLTRRGFPSILHPPSLPTVEDELARQIIDLAKPDAPLLTPKVDLINSVDPGYLSKLFACMHGEETFKLYLQHRVRLGLVCIVFDELHSVVPLTTLLFWKALGTITVSAPTDEAVDHLARDINLAARTTRFAVTPEFPEPDRRRLPVVIRGHDIEAEVEVFILMGSSDKINSTSRYHGPKHLKALSSSLSSTLLKLVKPDVYGNVDMNQSDLLRIRQKFEKDDDYVHLRNWIYGKAWFDEDQHIEGQTETPPTQMMPYGILTQLRRRQVTMDKIHHMLREANAPFPMSTEAAAEYLIQRTHNFKEVAATRAASQSKKPTMRQLIRKLMQEILSAADVVCTLPCHFAEAPYDSFRNAARGVVLEDAETLLVSDARHVIGDTIKPIAMRARCAYRRRTSGQQSIFFQAMYSGCPLYEFEPQWERPPKPSPPPEAKVKLLGKKPVVKVIKKDK